MTGAPPHWPRPPRGDLLHCPPPKLARGCVRNSTAIPISRAGTVSVYKSPRGAAQGHLAALPPIRSNPPHDGNRTDIIWTLPSPLRRLTRGRPKKVRRQPTSAPALHISSNGPQSRLHQCLVIGPRRPYTWAGSPQKSLLFGPVIRIRGRALWHPALRGCRRSCARRLAAREYRRPSDRGGRRA
jgi:hypothetical protein